MEFTKKNHKTDISSVQKAGSSRKWLPAILSASNVSTTNGLVVLAASLLFNGILLYLFMDSEIIANLHMAHVYYRHIREMLLPIVLATNMISMVLGFILIFILAHCSKRAGH